VVVVRILYENMIATIVLKTNTHVERAIALPSTSIAKSEAFLLISAISLTNHGDHTDVALSVLY
jgi:hypothetical protein